MSKKTATPSERLFQRVDDLVAKEQWQTIEDEATALLEAGDAATDLHFLLALAAFARHDVAAAVARARQAYDAAPGIAEYCDLLATLHGMAGDLNSASFFAKMASVGASSPRLGGWLPKSLPSFTEAFFEARKKPFFERALQAKGGGNWVDAEHWFGQHLAFHPRDGEAYAALAETLMIQGLYAAAVERLRAARHVVPGDARVASLLGSALTAIGQFAEGQAVHAAAKAGAPADPLVHAAAVGDRLADPAVEPSTIAADIADWTGRFAVAADALPPLRAGGSGRPTVGYVIGQLPRSGALSFLAQVLARHDPRRFRIVGFGSGELADPSNLPFQKCFEAWTDTREADALTFASMVRAEGVDILIDLGGLASPTLFRALAARVAPVQAVWSPVVYGMASQHVDVLLTDSFLDPQDRPAAVGGESLCRLQTGAVLALQPEVTDRPAVEPHGPVFAVDATLAEINLPTVEVWAQILAAVPDAVLLLRDHGFRSPDVTRRLIGLFGNFGVAHRIDVVSVEPAELFAQADVCLVPYPSMRPEAAVEAVAGGLPAITWSGRGRHRRIVGSALHFAGLGGEMLAESAEDYREMAVAWMRDAARREAFRHSIAERLAGAPLFDTAGRAADLERTYLELHKTATATAGSA